ncbi:MAG: SixA phosphatase family protein [Acidimicrobiia bacterium]
MAVVLVRHASAGERSEWPASDVERPLDAVGFGQAAALVPVIAALRPARLFSSPARRCMDTLRPAAAALGLPVEERDELFEGDVAPALALVRDLLAKGDTSVLCSHGDVIPAVLDSLSANDGLEGWLSTLRCGKGSAWVLDGRVARYIPTPD